MKLNLAYRYLSTLTVFMTTATLSSSSQLGSKPLKFNIGKTEMPYPVSDMTASIALASSSSEAQSLVFIIGGCDSLKGNVRAEWDETLFYCPTVTDRTIAYNPETNDFVNKKNMLRERYRHAAVVVNNMIWLVGGRDATDAIVREVDMYNPLTDEWMFVGNMTESMARSDLTAFASPAKANSFYVTGGYDSIYNAMNTTIQIDTETSISQNEIVFTRKSDLPTHRGDIQSVVLNDDKQPHAYVLGGYTPANNWCQALNVVEKYDLINDEWSTVPNMIHARGDKAAVVLEENIFVIGGESKIDECGVDNSDKEPVDPEEAVVPMDDVEIYDDTEKKWTVLQEIPSERFRFTGVAYPETNTIYIFGGQKYYSDKCDCFATSSEVLYLTHDDEVEDLLETSIDSSSVVGIRKCYGLVVAVAAFLNLFNFNVW